jgi:hypothetical protein
MTSGLQDIAQGVQAALRNLFRLIRLSNAFDSFENGTTEVFFRNRSSSCFMK